MTVAYTSFNYGGIPSSNFGIVSANPNDGLYQETFVADQTIVEVTIPGRSKPYYQDTTTSPLSFPLKLWLSDPSIFINNSTADFDLDKLEEIARWLTPSYYQPFYFEDNPDKIFYCKPNQSTQIVHDGLKNGGYITLTMRCNDSYAYSPSFVTEEYDFVNSIMDTYDTETYISDNYLLNDTYTFNDVDDSCGLVNYTLDLNDGEIYKTKVELDIKSSVNVLPEIWITKSGNGSVIITNQTNAGLIFQLNNLNDGETVYIDCENEDIESDIVGVYHYDDLIGDYMELVYGKNILKINGECTIQFRYQNKYRNGI